MNIDALHIKELINNADHISNLELVETQWYNEIQLNPYLAEIFEERKDLLLRTSIRSNDE